MSMIKIRGLWARRPTTEYPVSVVPISLPGGTLSRKLMGPFQDLGIGHTHSFEHEYVRSVDVVS